MNVVNAKKCNWRGNKKLFKKKIWNYSLPLLTVWSSFELGQRVFFEKFYFGVCTVFVFLVFFGLIEIENTTEVVEWNRYQVSS